MNMGMAWNGGRRGQGRVVATVLAVVFALAAWGCGGGGGGGGAPSPPPAQTVTLGGTIFAPAGIEIDSDVNDPNETYASNDDPGAPQAISNPTSVAGYVNKAGAGSQGRSYAVGDEWDLFGVTLNAGDRIFLAIGDLGSSGENDLDLYLADLDGQVLSASTGTGQTESLNAPGRGAFLVGVRAYSGASNYILTIGPDAGGAGEAADALSTSHEFVAGQAIVRFAEDGPRAMGSVRALAAGAAELGMTLVAGEPGRAVLLGFDADHHADAVFRALGVEGAPKRFGRAADRQIQRRLDTLHAIKAMRQRPDVVSAEPNFIRRLFATTPNDTFYSLQWHYPLINLPQAWDITTGSRDVVVAVIDTGVLMQHTDLQGQLTTGGYCFIRDRNLSGRSQDGIGPWPNDPGDRISDTATSSFHGTHCAGTIAATTNNNRGVAGVGWNTRILPIRALGKGGRGTSYDIIQAVRYAAALPNDSGIVLSRPADIINMSLGGGGASQEEQNVYNQVRDKGVIVIAAAGNSATNVPSYPASYNGVISVSAVNINATLASYSNYGDRIDVAAPGGDQGDLDGDGYPDMVWSTGGDDSSGSVQFNYRAMQGTSMAAPHVSGVAALMKALRPAMDFDMFYSFLQGGRITNDIGAPGRDNRYGWGLIDAHKAVLAAQDGPVAVTALRADPVSLNFGTAAASATVVVSKVGTGSLRVANAQTSAAWLRVQAVTVNADGLGTYTVLADRGHGGLAQDGSYSAAVTFVPDSGSPLTVPVNLTVNRAAGSPDAGFHYVLLVDADTYEILDQVDVRAADGRYAYQFTGVTPNGRYMIFAGSDRDNDRYIDNAGESLGAYPALSQVAVVVADRSYADLNFNTGLPVFLPEAGRFDEGGGYLPVLQRLR